MTETKATVRNIVACAECGNELYLCPRCEDYIKPKQKIICIEDGKHVHRGCYY